MKDLNIVLVNYFYKQDIPQALRSVFKDLEKSPYDVQVTVVDNSNNQDGIGKVLYEEFNQVVYINPKKNLGFGKGTALGFQHTPARYYFALNRDTIVPENTQAFDRLIAFMDKNPKIGCAGPKLTNMDGSLQHSCFRFDLSSIFIKPFKQINWDQKYGWVKKYTDRLLMHDFDHNETRPVDWVLGAAMMIRKEVVDAIGWFDDRYFMYMEDCDWCHAMWEKGWPVYYVHDVVIKHRHTRESAKVPGLVKALYKNKLARIHVASWLKYMWKWRKHHKYYGKIS
jgi:GT2 family glycosyltransferase